MRECLFGLSLESAGELTVPLVKVLALLHINTTGWFSSHPPGLQCLWMTEDHFPTWDLTTTLLGIVNHSPWPKIAQCNNVSLYSSKLKALQSQCHKIWEALCCWSCSEIELGPVNGQRSMSKLQRENHLWTVWINFSRSRLSLRSARHARGVRTSERSNGHEHGPAYLHQPSPDDLSPFPAPTRTPSPRVPARPPPRPPPSPPPPPRHADAWRTLVTPRNGHVCTETPFAHSHWPQYWRTRPGHPCPII